MSNLPQIDYRKVAERLSAENGSLALSKVTLEILAEELRTERDNALAACANLRQQLSARVDEGEIQ